MMQALSAPFVSLNAEVHRLNRHVPVVVLVFFLTLTVGSSSTAAMTSPSSEAVSSSRDRFLRVGGMVVERPKSIDPFKFKFFTLFDLEGAAATSPGRTWVDAAFNHVRCARP